MTRLLLGGLALVATLAACRSTNPDGLDVARLPAEIQPDYALFARRCSKCHSLARPLNSGIDKDIVWVNYVNRMRLQPGSGISAADAPPILRFLHYYALEQQRQKRLREERARRDAHAEAAPTDGGTPGEGGTTL